MIIIFVLWIAQGAIIILNPLSSKVTFCLQPKKRLKVERSFGTQNEISNAFDCTSWFQSNRFLSIAPISRHDLWSREQLPHKEKAASLLQLNHLAIVYINWMRSSSTKLQITSWKILERLITHGKWVPSMKTSLPYCKRKNVIGFASKSHSTSIALSWPCRYGNLGMT